MLLHPLQVRGLQLFPRISVSTQKIKIPQCHTPNNTGGEKGVCFQLSLLKILGAVKVRASCFQEQLCGPNNSKLAQVEEAQVFLQVVSQPAWRAGWARKSPGSAFLSEKERNVLFTPRIPTIFFLLGCHSQAKIHSLPPDSFKHPEKCRAGVGCMKS